MKKWYGQPQEETQGIILKNFYKYNTFGKL